MITQMWDHVPTSHCYKFYKRATWTEHIAPCCINKVCGQDILLVLVTMSWEVIWASKLLENQETGRKAEQATQTLNKHCCALGKEQEGHRQSPFSWQWQMIMQTTFHCLYTPRISHFCYFFKGKLKTSKHKAWTSQLRGDNTRTHTKKAEFIMTPCWGYTW